MRHIIKNLGRDRDDNERAFQSVCEGIEGLEKEILKQREKLPIITERINELNKAIRLLEKEEKAGMP